MRGTANEEGDQVVSSWERSWPRGCAEGERKGKGERVLHGRRKEGREAGKREKGRGRDRRRKRESLREGREYLQERHVVGKRINYKEEGEREGKGSCQPGRKQRRAKEAQLRAHGGWESGSR